MTIEQELREHEKLHPDFDPKGRMICCRRPNHKGRCWMLFNELVWSWRKDH